VASRGRPAQARARKAAAPTPQADEPQTDGRLNRSIVTRRKIVDAMTALIYEGNMSPTAEQVAQRADVSLRTVFRHFDDMDSLYSEISMAIEAQVLPLMQVRLTASSWQERLLQSIEFRTGIYDRVVAMHLAAQVHRHESAYLAQHLMDAARLQRNLLRRLLPDTVTRDATLLDALDLMLSMEAWIRLRREQGLSGADAREVMRRGVTALLATAGKER
jgi:AcrR family transcriptional regulator